MPAGCSRTAREGMVSLGTEPAPIWAWLSTRAAERPGAVSYTHLDVYKRQQLVTPMDDRDLAAKLGQIHGLFHRAVAAAYHVDVQILSLIHI